MRIHTMSLTLIATAGLLGCGKAVQPKPACRTQQNTYAARYLENPEITGMCDGKVLKGEVLHLAYYRTAPQGGIAKVGIEPASIADLVTAAEEKMIPVTRMPQEYSLGNFKEVFPDDQDICTAPTLSEAGVETTMPIPGDPMHVPPIPDTPPQTLKYKWSNVRFLTQPLSNAIHFGADLVRTDGDCTVKYKVSAINPVVHCGNGTKPKEDEHGMVVPGETMPDPESGEPDNEQCTPSKVGAASGTGLSPHFEYECVPGALICAPKHAFPARPKK